MYTVYMFKNTGEIVKRINEDLEGVIRDNFLKENRFVWVDMCDPKEDELKFLEEKIGIHTLEIEDALNVEDQNPKFNETKNHLFVTFLNPVIRNGNVSYENLAFFIFKNIIISIRNKRYSLFQKTIRRIYNKRRILRDRTSILHIFLDVIIDELLFVADKIDEEINSLEQDVFIRYNEEILERLYTLKMKIITLRKVIISQKEIIYNLTKPSKFVSSKQVVYFKDLYEHVILLINQFDLFRDSTNTILQIYLSLASQNTNEVMKVLTVITSIFLPLTLITGIYGMNFHYMPELTYKYGYFITLSVMVILAIILLYIYRRKGWI